MRRVRRARRAALRADARPKAALVLLALAALAGAAAGCERSRAAGEERLPTAVVTVGTTSVRAEVADTPERRARGLGGRPGLERGRGMLFAFERAGRHRFWMKDMRFDIDIVWIRGARVVELHRSVPHAEPGPLRTYRPAEPVDRVLEVPAGTAARHGWAPGDPVRVEPRLGEEGEEGGR